MTVRVVHCGTGLTGTDRAVVASRPGYLVATDLPYYVPYYVTRRVRSDG